MLRVSKSYIRDLAFEVIGCSIEVHRELGAGLLESVYEHCLKYELSKRGITFLSQQRIPLRYKDLDLEADLRYDLLVEGCLLVELKSCEGIIPIHEAVLLTYMKLLEIPKGLILNFNTTNLSRHGLISLVNEHYSELSP